MATQVIVKKKKLSDGSEVFNVVLVFPLGGRVTCHMDSEKSAEDLEFQFNRIFDPEKTGIPTFGKANGIIEIWVDGDDFK